MLLAASGEQWWLCKPRRQRSEALLSTVSAMRADIQFLWVIQLFTFGGTEIRLANHHVCTLATSSSGWASWSGSLSTIHASLLKKNGRQLAFLVGGVAINSNIPPKHVPVHLNKNVFETRKGPISNACASCQNAYKSHKTFLHVPLLFSCALWVWYNMP